MPLKPIDGIKDCRCKAARIPADWDSCATCIDRHQASMRDGSHDERIARYRVMLAVNDWERLRALGSLIEMLMWPSEQAERDAAAEEALIVASIKRLTDARIAYNRAIAAIVPAELLERGREAKIEDAWNRLFNL